MAVDDLGVIDIEVPYENGDLRMVIIDGLAWTNDEVITDHLNALLRKIKFYLDIAESDTFRQKYPNTTLENITIEIVLRYPPPLGVEDFLKQYAGTLAPDGITLVYNVHAG
ncbi:DUF6572 domain-containing protein [Neorhizobium alkalisoli]|uniref:DUF6572 domain-containing protein n=1 Tax=Neorhizobium alkalisoli TaxID=528178 RepID=UPI000CF9097C|nr:DUF6572 domain-containing protein [Neorhizobium alkalisoli]